jgi:hypothetical protein
MEPAPNVEPVAQPIAVAPVPDASTAPELVADEKPSAGKDRKPRLRKPGTPEPAKPQQPAQPTQPTQQPRNYDPFSDRK